MGMIPSGCSDDEDDDANDAHAADDDDDDAMEYDLTGRGRQGRQWNASD